MRPNTVMRVFVIQGALIGLVGILGGVLAGVLLTLNLDSVVALIESTFHIDLMPKDVYYITGVPTALRAADVTLIAVVAFAMCLLATVYPAWRAVIGRVMWRERGCKDG